MPVLDFTPINVRARNSARFPSVFASTTHPMLTKNMTRALVFLLGTKQADRKRRAQDERELKIPSESDDRALERQGNEPHLLYDK